MNFLEKVKLSFDKQRIMAELGARLVHVDKGHCEIELPYNIAFTQQDQFMHAGIIGTIADSAAGYAAYTMMNEDQAVLSIEYKINLLAPAIGDSFIARAKVIRSGRTITVCQSDVYARQGNVEKHCATAIVSLIAVKRVDP